MILGVVASACGGGGATSTPTPTATVAAGPKATSPATLTPTPKAEETTVFADIINTTHVNLTVKVGTTVTWLHGDPVPHTVTAGTPENPTGEWDSGFLNEGDSFTHTFNEVGEFPYFCTVHPSIMRATVTVVESLAGQTSSSGGTTSGASSNPYNYE